MIARLSGLLDSVSETACILDVGGVGYQVFCSARTLRNLPRPGEAVRLHIETHVREDHIHLFGFLSEAERGWFNLLQTVQGVGAKVALGILSALAPDELFRAIASADKTTLNRCDGVGPKLAVRLITELKDKVGGIALGTAAQASVGEAGAVAVAETGAVADALSALVNLGYKRADAFGAVTAAARNLGEKPNVQELIRAGLKELAR
ncbi:MAG: Holliday junction branch migration protein RuvA [Ferrovibrio sp.]|uniref:Holliday junction branch migration protein RuvA n=1 Tax=Ferrovibrio sp. TaxID=1917215 RepID=UPI00260E96E6|nr:Holliday junction branch migration protein RuvA [Ferrovibrio sp.]MCW0236149.1 Holliday junction branch migration protein RuvA [Ferrovibrio sp.]